MLKESMPIWVLIAIPSVWAVSLICAVAFKSIPAAVQISLLAGLFSIAAAFVIVPTSIYALISNSALRTSKQIAGIALCAIPIVGIFASFFSGGI